MLKTEAFLLERTLITSQLAAAVSQNILCEHNK